MTISPCPICSVCTPMTKNDGFYSVTTCTKMGTLISFLRLQPRDEIMKALASGA